MPTLAAALEILDKPLTAWGIPRPISSCRQWGKFRKKKNMFGCPAVVRLRLPCNRAERGKQRPSIPILVESLAVKRTGCFSIPPGRNLTSSWSADFWIEAETYGRAGATAAATKSGLTWQRQGSGGNRGRPSTRELFPRLPRVAGPRAARLAENELLALRQALRQSAGGGGGTVRFLGSVDCTIRHDEMENDYGTTTPVVYARCPETGIEAGPVWGCESPSIRRALAMLSSKCDCGRFHRERKTRSPSNSVGNMLERLPENLADYYTPAPD